MLSFLRLNSNNKKTAVLKSHFGSNSYCQFFGWNVNALSPINTLFLLSLLQSTFPPLQLQVRHWLSILHGRSSMPHTQSSAPLQLITKMEKRGPTINNNNGENGVRSGASSSVEHILLQPAAPKRNEEAKNLQPHLVFTSFTNKSRVEIVTPSFRTTTEQETTMTCYRERSFF